MNIYQYLTPLLGRLIAPYLRRMAQKIKASAYDPYSFQKKALHKIVKACGDTELGKRLGLIAVHSMEDARKLPETNYTLLREDFERIFHAGLNARGIISHSPVQGFALTTGTTGGPKRFPITTASLAAFKHDILQINAATLCNLQRENEIMLGKRIALSNQPKLTLSPTGLPVGYISGYILLNSGWAYRKLTLPSEDILSLPNWKEKQKRLLAESTEQDIRFISGFPAVLKSFTEAALEYYKISHLRLIWPNLFACAYGGNLFSDVDKKWLAEKWIGDADYHHSNFIFAENYSATEGIFGFTCDPAWPGLVFNPEIFFQFKEKPDDKSFLQLHELKHQQKYLVFITTNNGLINYAMEDWIEITSIQPLTFRFFARAHEHISVISEKIVTEELQAAVETLSQQLGIRIDQFAAWLEEKQPNAIIFALGSNNDITLTEVHHHILDQALRGKNFAYDIFRRNGVYDLPKTLIYPKSLFTQYINKRLNQGTLKEKRIFKNQYEFETIMKS